MAETLTLSLPEDLGAALRQQAQARGAEVQEVAVRLLTEGVRTTGPTPLSEAELRKIVANLAGDLAAASKEENEWLRQVFVAEAEDTLMTLWRRRPIKQGPWARMVALLLDVLRLNSSENLQPKQLQALNSVVAPLASVELAEGAVSMALDRLEEVGLITFPDIPDAAWETQTETDEV